MAARPLLLGLASATRFGAVLRTPVGNIPSRVRTFSLSGASIAPTVATPTTSFPSSGNPAIHQAKPSPPTTATAGETADDDAVRHAAFLGEADSNDGHEAYREAHGVREPALDATLAAFLGEADSDDAFEARKIEEGDRHEALDAKHAAFLGEADSDDAFEARKAEEGDKHESMDATNAAFLGEADSDDGFEADVEVHPERHRHAIEDTTPSGFHGERGEMDSNERVA